MMARFPYPARPGRRLIRIVIFAIVIAALSLPVAATAASAAATCDRVFSGNATGARDVTSSLTSFIAHHGGRRLCLKTNGVYRVNGTIRLDGVSGLRLNGRNATIRATTNLSTSAQRNQLRIENGRDISIKNLKIRGMDPSYSDWNPSRQQEHGIAIYGGGGIKLINVRVRNTYGDGVYVGYNSGRTVPPVGILLSHVNISGAGRNGVGVTGGSYIRISHSAIANVSLTAIDLEPDSTDADIHNVTVERSTMRRFGMSHAYTGWAFAANGKAGYMSYLNVLYNTGYPFAVTVQNEVGGIHRHIVVKGNVSSVPTHAYFMNVEDLTFSGNVRITKHIE